MGRKWAAELAVLVAVVLFAVAMAHPRFALRNSHPKRGALVQKVNMNGPYFAILMTFAKELNALVNADVFTANSDVPYIEIAGRIFNIGTIKGVNVIYVMSGEQMVNAALTMQILIDTFDLYGIIHYGIAGSSNNSLTFGSVSVVKYAAFTASWHWQSIWNCFLSMHTGIQLYGTSDNVAMKFGSYNYPEAGGNLLGTIEFDTTEFYSPTINTTVGKTKVFWFEVDSELYDIAATYLTDVKLDSEVNSTYTLPVEPKVAFGLYGGTADTFLHNAAFRDFLYNNFNVSTTDEETASVIMVSNSNEVPCIVFRSVSDMSGSEKIPGAYELLAAKNAVIAVVKYLEVIGDVYGLARKSSNQTC
ncbi:bark storage protein A-like [Rutidosis leptorrhynchoides]|uniref:bark storage protein A-like n=1 Tax=Rutidosis leptorrhynchoides TaxID=125765 RepID=UPI003A99B5CF